MIIEIVMSILFNRRISLQVDPIIFYIRKINSKSSQRYMFHPFQVAFVLATLPPFFFKDSDFLIKYPFYRWKSLHSFPSCSYPVILMKMIKEASSVSFFVSLIFPGVFNAIFQCWSYLFLVANAFPMTGAPHNHSLLATHFSGVLKISQKARLVIQDPFNLFRGCYLIQAV